MKLGTAVRRLRESRQESQQFFASALGISISALANYEKDRRVPSVLTLAMLKELAAESDCGDEPFLELSASFEAELVKYELAGDVAKAAAQGLRRLFSK